MLNHETHSSLLYSVAWIEFPEVIKSSVKFILSGSSFVIVCNFFEPWMLYALFSWQSLFWILSKHFNNQVFSRHWNFIPNTSFNAELSILNCFDNLHIWISIEWRASRQEHVEDNTDGPDITLFVIIASKNLWGNVICSSKNTMEWFIGSHLSGLAKI